MNQLDHNPPESVIDWISYAQTSVGHVRKANEDSFLDAREQGLWVVADGMGGHSRGDRASQTIIEKLLSFQAQAKPEDNIADLRARLEDANQACRSMAAGKVIGSTVVAMYSHKATCHLLWAGDSRVYRLRQNTLTQLTEDHSLVQELCRLGELTPDEAENHPSSNVITRAIGVHEKLELDVIEIAVEPGDRFLICSDGLFKDVKFDEVREKLCAPSAQQALRELVKQALDRGGTDNVTAIVVQAGYQ
ncbi:MAG: protein phosphatase 2C domain-containing protein [Gammaproteobacteria bacterium]|nr:protein phosphatase 2C domain-containing protein [Gammaproteobacteria bacterium]